MTAEKKQRLALTFLSVLSHPDAETIKSVTVEDFVWSFPGASQISGEAHGVDGVMMRAQTIASYGVKVEVGQTVYGFSGWESYSTTQVPRTAECSMSKWSPFSHSETTGFRGWTPIFPTWQWQKPSSGRVMPFTRLDIAVQWQG